MLRIPFSLLIPLSAPAALSLAAVALSGCDDEALLRCCWFVAGPGAPRGVTFFAPPRGDCGRPRGDCDRAGPEPRAELTILSSWVEGRVPVRVARKRRSCAAGHLSRRVHTRAK